MALSPPPANSRTSSLGNIWDTQPLPPPSGGHGGTRVSKTRDGTEAHFGSSWGPKKHRRKRLLDTQLSLPRRRTSQHSRLKDTRSCRTDRGEAAKTTFGHPTSSAPSRGEQTLASQRREMVRNRLGQSGVREESLRRGVGEEPRRRDH